MAASSTKQATQSTMHPTPDLVLQISCPLSDKDAVKEYLTISQNLRTAGLKVTSRWGATKDEVLVFVKAKEAMVRDWREAERLSDWMNGIPPSAAENDSMSARSFIQSPITSAQRIRLLHAYITNPRDESTNGITGLGISPDSGYPHLKDIFPPHDPDFNHAWLREWRGADGFSFNQMFSISEESLIRIKNHFGESVAFYFEFLRFYFLALTFPALLGFFTWATFGQYSTVYASGLILWGIIFISRWQVRERNLAINWGVASTSKVLKRRSKPTKKETISTTTENGDEDDNHSVWIRKQLKILSAVPVVIIFATFLAAVITGIFTTEIVLTEVYNGPFKTYLTLVPTVLFVGLVPQVINVWTMTATKLVEWEDHQHQISFEQSLTLKMFALTFFVSYGGLFLTTYIYTPFASLIVPKITQLLHVPVHTDTDKPFAFHINSDRLYKQMFAYTVTNQVVNTLVEVVVPVLTRKGLKTVQKVTKKDATGPVDDDSTDEEEKTWLKRVREESQLPEYSLFVDYSEMVIQLGYVLLWSVVLPLAPVFALVNNFFELRGDAFKLCVNSKRPIPRRTDTIGPWLSAMGFLSWIGAITNTSIIYLFRSRSKSELTSLSHLKHSTETTLAPFSTSRVFIASQTSDPYESIKSAVLTSLLMGLATEHVYFVLRFLVQTAVERIFWTGGKAHLRLRNNEKALKKRFLESPGVGAPSPRTTNEGFVQVENEKDDGEGAFWTRTPKALEELKQGSKME